MDKTKDISSIIKDSKRIVIKIGSSVLKKGDSIDKNTFLRIGREVKELLSSGKEVIIVSSGAILFGRRHLEVKKPFLSLTEKQALAAIGQVLLMEAYKKSFERFGIKIAQILFTHSDFRNHQRRNNCKNTIERLLAMNVLPVINENDSVATEEIKIGDNDHLSAMIALTINADLLLLLTNTSYVYRIENKKPQPVKHVRNRKELNELMAYAKGASSPETTGGMITKLEAADIAMRGGTWVIISNGKKKGCISSILKGNPEGTYFWGSEKALSSVQKWLLSCQNEEGEIIIDEGALKALLKDGKSLLPVGVLEVRGKFEKGSAVKILSKEGEVVGKGKVEIDSELLNLIKGKRTSEIKKLIEKPIPDEVIHRDNMVILI